MLLNNRQKSNKTRSIKESTSQLAYRNYCISITRRRAQASVATGRKSIYYFLQRTRGRNTAAGLGGQLGGHVTCTGLYFKVASLHCVNDARHVCCVFPFRPATKVCCCSCIVDRLFVVPVNEHVCVYSSVLEVLCDLNI